MNILSMAVKNIERDTKDSYTVTFHYACVYNLMLKIIKTALFIQLD